MAINLHQYFRFYDDETFKVYKVLDSCGRIKYIGCTYRSIHQRLSSHISTGSASKIKNGYSYFFKAVRDGKTKASVELIQEFDNPFNASELESKLIKENKNLLNRNRNVTYAQDYSIERYNQIIKRGGKALLQKFIDKYRREWEESYKKFEANYSVHS